LTQHNLDQHTSSDVHVEQFWKRKRTTRVDCDAIMDESVDDGTTAAAFILNQRNDHDDAVGFMEDNADGMAISATANYYENNTDPERCRTGQASALLDTLATSTTAMVQQQLTTEPMSGQRSSPTSSSGQQQQTLQPMIVTETLHKPRQVGTTRVTPTPYNTTMEAARHNNSTTTTAKSDGLGRSLFPQSVEKGAASGSNHSPVPIPSFKKDTKGRDDAALSLEGSIMATGQAVKPVPVDLVVDRADGRGVRKRHGRHQATPSIPDVAVPDGEVEIADDVGGHWPLFHDVFFGCHDELACKAISANDTAMLMDLDLDTNEPAVHDAMFAQLSGYQNDENFSCLGQWTVSVVTFALSVPLLYQLFRFLTEKITDADGTTAGTFALLFVPGDGYVGVVDIT
jgi:hypothetical protein